MNIYLTLDDGWFERRYIVEMANYYKVPISMFLIGKVIEADPLPWQKAIERGHELGCHTYSHPKCSKITGSFFSTDLKNYKKVVIKHLGKSSFDGITTFRFPFGDKGNKGNKQEIETIIRNEFGCQICWWNMDLSFKSNFYGIKSFSSPEEQLRFFSKNVQNHQVVLMHFKKPDSKGLENIIRYGLDNNFRFKRVSDKV
jgi:peptidoglycan/xylan/chitin deacetylase (PgdA/CDA1 family)